MDLLKFRPSWNLPPSLRGVNICGAEFGQANLPGLHEQHYHYNAEPTFRYFAQKGLRLQRVAVRWERLQPVLNAELDPLNLQLLTRNADDAAASGAAIIIEPHNHARRWIPNASGGLDEHIIDDGFITRDHFADFWVRMSQAFRNHPGVWAYNLTNEPHDMGRSSWREISQHAVAAIRASGDDKPIVVPGDSWANATVWEQVNGSEDWILDPANNIWYEAHLYFDPDFSGTYKQPYAADPQIGVRRVRPFLAWCRRNNVRGMLGEYGVPRDPRWYEVLDRFLTELDENGFPGLYWAAGEWWGEYELTVQPTAAGDRPQMAILERHLLPTPDLLVCATPSSRGLAIAPSSLATAMCDRITPDARIDVGPVAAEVIHAEPGHLNFVVPPSTPEGITPVRLWLGSETLATARLRVERVAPALFGHFRLEGDSVILYGTGVRYAPGAISFGSRPVRDIRPHAEWPGIDEIEVQAPPPGPTLALRAEGRSSNAISLAL